MKKLFTFLLLGLFMISMVSALEFDNVYNYNSNTRIATIKNAFGLGDDIATVQLLTPLNLRVAQGYGKVAEFKIAGFQDYKNTLKELELYDRKDNMRKFERNYDYKKKTYEDVLVDDYGNVFNGYTENGTSIYSYEKVGSHYERREVWTKLTPADIKKDEVLIIGIFTDVQEGDSVEWIPNMFGIRVEEWASWTEDLNVNLIEYYKLDDNGANTTAIGSAGNITGIAGTNTNNLYDANGIINSAFNFSYGDYGVETNSGLGSIPTIRFWVRMGNSAVAGSGRLGGNRFNAAEQSGDFHMTIDQNGYLDINAYAPTSTHFIGTTAVDDGNWHHFVIFSGAGGLRVYLDGNITTPEISNANTVVLGNGGSDVFSLGKLGENGVYYYGIPTIDEVAFWSIRQDTDFVTQDYNNGNAISYTDDFTILPNATLISPSNNTEYVVSPQSINFTCYGSDSINFTEMEFYLNGSLTQTNSSGLNNTNYIFTESLTDGNYNWSCVGTNNESQQAESETWFLTVDTTPFIDYNTPPTAINNYNSSTSNILVNVSLTETYFYNVTFMLSNGTSYTFTDGTREIDYNFVDGSYYYNVTTCTTTGKCNTTENRNITIDTTPFIEFLTPPTLINNTNITQEYIPMKVNSTTSQFQNITYSLRNVNGTNYTQFYTNETYDINFTNIPDGHYHYDVTICATTDKCNTTETRHINHDANPPTITITAPTGVLGFIFAGDNETLNWSVSDDRLESCWYTYDETNYSINCSLNTTEFVYVGGANNLTFYANDTFGNIGSELTTWDYTLTELATGFDSPVVEGSTTIITANVTLQAGLRVSSVVLNYNGTEFPGSNVEYATDTYFLSISKVIPGIGNDENVTFFWNVTLEGGSSQETNTNNQTIINVSIDDCSIFTNTIFNFTIVDETTQVLIDGAAGNTSLKIDIALSSVDNSSNQIIQFSKGYSEINPAAVCINNLMGNSTLRMDAVIEYTAGEKFTEFYNIQKFVFDETTASQNITLFSLKESEGLEFKVTYKGQDFIPVRDIILQIQRKYIDEGEFKTIEIPMSGSNAYTIAHLIPNDVIYNLIFLKNGSILDTFTEVVADCQNPTIAQCEINLNALITGSDLFNIVEEDDFFSSLTFDKTTREVSSTYGIISGASGLTSLNVTLIDNFGNNTACSDSLVAAGGTLSCIVPSSFGDSVVYARVIFNDDPRREGYISLKDSPKDQYKGILIFSSIILLLFIFGIGVSDSPGLTGIFLIIGVLLLVGLNIFYSTSWVGAGATVLWFIVAVIMIIVKGGSKR